MWTLQVCSRARHAYLVIVDTHSKWPEVIEMKSTTTASLIVELRRVFPVFGLPQQLVSDNGPQFISAEFEKFMKENGVKHVRPALITFRGKN